MFESHWLTIELSIIKVPVLVAIKKLWTMFESHRLTIQLSKIKVPMAIIKKQINNVWWPEAGCWAQETQGPSGFY
jgi:hypothetical protein